MAAYERASETTCLGDGVCGDFDRQCDRVSSNRKLVAAANVDRDGLPVRGAAQLVRSTLLPNASARQVRPLTQLFHRGVRWNRRAESRLRFAAGDVLRERLVGCELAKCDRCLEYSDGLVDQHAGADAGPAKIESRLVLGPANRVCPVRGKLALA